MYKLEEELSKNKTVIDSLAVPDELEARLHDALSASTEPKRSKSGIIFTAAACLLIVCMFTWSDTLAYYGQRLMGYDQVMNATLQELNKLGKGQKIGQSWQFEKGPMLILDGIMLDDNQLIAFYTIKGSEADIYNLTLNGMQGRMDYQLQSAVGECNAQGTEIKYQASFEAPYFFEKNLAFTFQWQDPALASPQYGKIDFTINRRQAMGHSLKNNLHINKKIGDRKIRFDSILASPTSTVISGTIATPWELARDQVLGERIRPMELAFQLIANEQPLAEQTAGLSTGVDGIRFSCKFDALPSHLDSLNIQLNSITADFDVNERITIDKEVHDKTFMINGQRIIIHELTESNGDSFLTISSDESTVLTRVFMNMDGQMTDLNETISDSYNKSAAGQILHTRTLHFSGKGDKLQLIIERMTYKTACRENFMILPGK